MNPGLTMKEKEMITTDDIAISNRYQLEALIRVLANKGILSQQEMLDELQLLQVEQAMTTENNAEA